MHVLAQVAMPAETASALTDLGASITTTLAGVSAGDVVVFPAHGVTADLRAEAARRGATVIDGTCPLVAAAQTAAGRTAGRGHQLVLVGHPGQASTAPIISQAPGHVTVVETPAKTAALRVSDARDVSYLMQPGVTLESGAPILASLRSRYPAMKAAVPADVCYAPSDRAGTTYAVALGSDLMLVLGDPEAADTRQVCAQARDSGTRVQTIGAVADLRPQMLAGVQTIGLAESTSMPAALAAQVMTALSGLGRLTVARRKLSTEKSPGALA